MVERPIPQDVMKYKAKLIGNFSMRQCIAAIVIAAVMIPTFFLFAKDLDMPGPIKLGVCAIPALPAIIIGFMPIMGLPAEKVAIPVFFDNFVAPQTRKKEIHNEAYEKYRKMNYNQLQAYHEKLNKALTGEEGSLEALQKEMEEEDTSKKGKKKKKNEKFKVTKSSEYPGIK